MPWWAYGPIGMQLWFPSLVLAAMQPPHLRPSSSGQLRSPASLTAALLPQPLMLSRSGSLTPIAALSPHMSSLTPCGSFTSVAAPITVTSPVAAGGGPRRGAMLPPLSPLTAASAFTKATAAAAAAVGIKHACSAPLLLTDHQQLLLLGHSAAAVPAAALIDSGADGSHNNDMELEFDREVYPIGVSLADASIVGVTQRMLRPQASGSGGMQVGGAERILGLGFK